MKVSGGKAGVSFVRGNRFFTCESRLRAETRYFGVQARSTV
jgi:hypothetical protein